MSKALMETISIIAYKQPVTRGDIEDIRGVSVNTRSIRNLLERNWIKISGYKEVPWNFFVSRNLYPVSL